MENTIILPFWAVIAYLVIAGVIIIKIFKSKSHE